MTKVHKQMPIAEILELIPDSVEIMLDNGLHCVGCHANMLETLEQGMLGHGFNDEQINEMVELINALADQTAEIHTPDQQDMKAKKIKEGNKIYFKIAGLMFTDNAYKAVHNLATAQALQIRIEAGGCSGYSLNYEFTDKPKQDEKEYTLSKKLKIFMNDFTFDKIYGSVADFESGLKGSGLKFENPNVKGACSCGTSWSF